MTNEKKYQVCPGSFRDPSGFIFSYEGKYFRQVNNTYKDNYNLLIESGLYDSLTNENLLISHKEVNQQPPIPESSYKVILPEQIPFISYPYEWSFSQIKEAALATLAIQKKALEFGMILKDASAYNIQFIDGNPVFIDTLSFEKYEDDQPWVAYKQFCQHFLAPLSLIAYRYEASQKLLTTFLDGIPLDVASSLLPLKSYFNFGLFIHIHSHAKSIHKHSDTKKTTYSASAISFKKANHFALISNIQSTIKKLSWLPHKTEWADYYSDTNYESSSFSIKKSLVEKFISYVEPKTVWDVGGNTGEFSRLAANKNIFTVSMDIDPAAVEKNYLQLKTKNEKNLLPLLIDLSNPSPAIGWNNNERMDLTERGPVELILALALIHHLAITYNITLQKIASFYASLTNFLVIEFIPKEDSQVKRLLKSRKDIFADFTESGFENAFKENFNILEKSKIEHSCRTLYLMKNKREIF